MKRTGDRGPVAVVPRANANANTFELSSGHHVVQGGIQGIHGGQMVPQPSPLLKGAYAQQHDKLCLTADAQGAIDGVLGGPAPAALLPLTQNCHQTPANPAFAVGARHTASLLLDMSAAAPRCRMRLPSFAFDYLYLYR